MCTRLNRASRQLGWRSWWWEWRTSADVRYRTGDIALETQQDSDSSDEGTQDTQASGGTQKGKGKSTGKSFREGKEKADKRSNKPTVLFSAEEEQKLVDFLHDNEILYNKHLMDYKDRSKREAVWDKFCEENNMDKDACQNGFRASAHSLERSLI